MYSNFSSTQKVVPIQIDIVRGKFELLTCTDEFLGTLDWQFLLERPLDLVLYLLLVGCPLFLHLGFPLLLLLLALSLCSVLLATCPPLLRT